MTGAEAAGARAATTAARRAGERLSEAARARGLKAVADDDGVRLSGRGLRRRMADDPALRWIGGWLR